MNIPRNIDFDVCTLLPWTKKHTPKKENKAQSFRWWTLKINEWIFFALFWHFDTGFLVCFQGDITKWTSLVTLTLTVVLYFLEQKNTHKKEKQGTVISVVDIENKWTDVFCVVLTLAFWFVFRGHTCLWLLLQSCVALRSAVCVHWRGQGLPRWDPKCVLKSTGLWLMQLWV